MEGEKKNGERRLKLLIDSKCNVPYKDMKFKPGDNGDIWDQLHSGTPYDNDKCT